MNSRQGIRRAEVRTSTARQYRQAGQPYARGVRGQRRLSAPCEGAGRDAAAGVVELVKNSNLRGRGGAGFPTGLKWTFLPKDHPGPIYMCINADESEPGTFNNRILMEEDPHQVIEGIILSCYATHAKTAYLYLRYEYPLCLERLQAAIDECYAAGYLGKNILGSEFSLDIFLHRGAAAYICGEETGLIESLEGKRAWPRIKPPFPAVEGVFRKPTVVNNIETVACVTHIVNRGVEWFKSIGVPADPKNPRDPGSYGPKLYCLSGHVNKPGCYEAPLGITCRQLIDEYGGGVWKGRKGKAAIPGGISMGLLTEKRIRYPARFRWARSRRLPGARHRGRGRAGRNCQHGRLPAQQLPVLSPRMLRAMHPLPRGDALVAGNARADQGGQGPLKDLDLLLEIGDSIGIIPGTTICGLADGAAWPIKNAIRKFRSEFEEYIKRTNPQGYAVTHAVKALPVLSSH